MSADIVLAARFSRPSCAAGIPANARARGTPGPTAPQPCVRLLVMHTQAILAAGFAGKSGVPRAVFVGLLRMPPGGLTVDIHRSWAPNDACRRSDHVRRRRQWKPSGARKGAPEPCDLGRRCSAGVTRPASATAARPAPRDARETPLAVGTDCLGICSLIGAAVWRHRRSLRPLAGEGWGGGRSSAARHGAERNTEFYLQRTKTWMERSS